MQEVSKGTRYVLAMWFTTSHDLGLEVHSSEGGASAVQVSTLGRQKEIQSVLTSMRRDIREVLAGIQQVSHLDIYLFFVFHCCFGKHLEFYAYLLMRLVRLT